MWPTLTRPADGIQRPLMAPATADDIDAIMRHVFPKASSCGYALLLIGYSGSGTRAPRWATRFPPGRVHTHAFECDRRSPHGQRRRRAEGRSDAQAGSPMDAGTATAAMSADCANIDCPQCDLGERPIMAPGQCCPTACEAIPSVDPATSLDAGSCAPAPLPGCNSNNWPYCAPDWSTAMSWYMGCPSPLIGAYLAQCGMLDAIIVPVMGGSRRYFYDAFGRLIGFENVVDGAHASCEAYDPSFAVPSAPCVPVDVACPDAGQPEPMQTDLESIGAAPFVTWDGGTPDCAAGQTAYEAFLTSQLAMFDTCVDSSLCQGGFPDGPRNPCTTPCNIVFSPAAINSQILSRLDTFGFVACAGCEAGPGAGCSFIPMTMSQCVAGHCTQ